VTRKVHIRDNFDAAVNEAATVLACDGVAIFPTETVYGIGALALGQEDPAVQRIYHIKDRPESMPLPVLIHDISWLDWFAPEAPAYARALAERYWPGPLTLIVQVSEEASALCSTSSDGTIGVRCPRNEYMQALLAKTKVPIYATSANSHGKPSPKSADELESQLYEAADIVIDGGVCVGGVASTVVRCTGVGPEIVRLGEITEADLNDAIQQAQGNS